MRAPWSRRAKHSSARPLSLLSLPSSPFLRSRQRYCFRRGKSLRYWAGMRKLLIVITFLFTALPLCAQWRRANLYGADVRALTIDPSNPDTLYLGTSGGEVYVSTDGAKSWRNPRGGIPFPGYVV